MCSSDLSVRENSLREEYALFFDDHLGERPSLVHHPLITQSLAEHVCGLCGSSKPESIAKISAICDEKKCPLCNDPLQDKPPVITDMTRLTEIDKELAQTKKAINNILKTLSRLREEDVIAKEKWQTTKTTLGEFEKENSTTIESLRNLLANGDANVSLPVYKDELAVLEEEKKTAYGLRAQLKEKLRKLQQDLQQQYLKVEGDFVPRFNDLAYHFLGMPLNIQMNAGKDGNVKFVIEVRGSNRRYQQDLSESQQFFLDIALRMALTQHMSDSSAQGGMFIDTPEGSLDIAYEKRAGEMLAMFAGKGHQIIMTANLNSSQLLLNLAKQCGRDGIKLCRMTDWSELSEVQQEEEGLFNAAFRDIETAMGSHE